MKVPKLAAWPAQTTIFEVGPRDGLQAEAATLSVDQRVELIRALIATGLPDIEIGSFVRADRIPQLAGSDEVLRRVLALPAAERGKARLWAFIPNQKGLDAGLAAGIGGASLFVAVSDTFARKNVNRGRDEILAELGPLFKQARKSKVRSRVYMSTLVYCPYEGPVDPKKAAGVVDRLADLGASEIVLSDTTGHANPRSLRKLLEIVCKKHAPKLFALHLHDTRGLALANILEALNFGLARFDSSAGGMGGCPYAPGATGNLATEDLVNMLAGMGLIKGIDLGRLAAASMLAEKFLGKQLPSKVLRTLEGA